MVFQQYSVGSSNSYCVTWSFVEVWIISVTCLYSILGRYTSPSAISSSGGCKGQKPRVGLGGKQRRVFLTSLMVFAFLSCFLRVKKKKGKKNKSGDQSVQGACSCSNLSFHIPEHGVKWRGCKWENLQLVCELVQVSPTLSLSDADWFYGWR